MPPSRPAAPSRQLSDSMPDQPPLSVSPTPVRTQQPKILQKSSSIISKTNYISPYRQTPPVRSVSSPLANTSSPGNLNAANFKDIVNRFNNKQDEKIPNPSNRIPAVVAGPVALRTRKPSAPWKPAGGSGGGSGQSGATSRSRTPSRSKTPSGSNTPSTGRARAGERSASTLAQVSSNRGKTTSRSRRPLSSMSNVSEDSGASSRHLLPPLDTSLGGRSFIAKGHRRSRSAVEIHSPSAASLADTEGETSSAGFSVHPLRHRRSRSNTDIFASPINVMEVDAIFARSAVEPRRALSPHPLTTGKSNIPIARRNSPATDHRWGVRNPSSRNATLAPVAVSAHGSRHPPQPSTSPRLAAYINAPQLKKSPPLRSTRGQRLPSNNSAAASRQKFQNHAPNSPYSKEANFQRGRSLKGFEPEGRGKDLKKKIPELGTVDFAARRAQIQNAFIKSLKDGDAESKTGAVHKGISKQGLRGEIFDTHQSASTDVKSGFQERIDEEDEDQLGESPASVAKDRVPGEEEVPGDSGTIESGFVSVIPTRSDSVGVDPYSYFDKPELKLWDTRSASSSRKSSLSSVDATPLPAEAFHTNQEPGYSQSVSEGSSAESAVSPTTEGEPPSLREPRSQEPPIPVIVTTDMPSDSLHLMQIPQLLRPDSTMTAWSIEIGQSRGSLMQDGTAHHLTNGTGAIYGVSMLGQRGATTRTNRDSISGTSDTTERANLSPMTNTSASSTPQDDRATIADVFDHYDEPREDFLKSYADTEGEVTEFETGTDTVDEYVDYLDEDTEEGETEGGEAGETEAEETETRETETEGTETEGGMTEGTEETEETEETESETETETETESETETEREDTEVGDTTGTEGYDDECVEDSEQCEYTSCSEIPSSARASIDDQSEGWETSWSPASPEMDIFPTRRQPPIQFPDSPTTLRQYMEEAESPLPPTPPPKDYQFLPPAPPAKDPPRAVSPAPSAMSSPPMHTSNRMALHSPQLPEIERDSEPLGLAINAFPTFTERSSSPLPPPPPTGRPSLDRWGSSSSNMDSGGGNSRQSQDSQYHYSGRPGLDHFSANRPSLDRSHSLPRKQSDSPASSFYSEFESRHSSVSAGFRNSETPASSMAPTKRESSSIHSQEQFGPRETPEQKLLIKRRHLLKELVDTESSYFRDMTVAMEIYKGTANACSSMSSDDIKVLFGNTDAVVQFSKAFLDALKAAIGSVYKLRNVRSGVNSSAVSVANSSNSGDEGSRKSFVEDLASEEEKDQKTYVGEVFVDTFYNMERVYGEYCKNHDTALGRLLKLQTNRGVAVWLHECKACAEDLTNAWNLESLLIKPVQRILKYPLLLTQLLECTPRSHPDFAQLDVAAKEMKLVADRINEMKKRKDMVERIVGPKKGDTDLRHGFSKGFARRAEKLKQSVGLSAVVVDETYNKLFENYNMHFVQVQVIIRDIEIYTLEIQTHVEQFLDLTDKMREFVGFAPSQHPEIESKWRRFDSAMREMAVNQLAEHKFWVRKHSIEPLEKLLKMHESPQRIMTKRNKKAVDYARYRAIIERRDVPDKRTRELADAYVALNETLIDELPKLFRLTKRLIDVILMNFVELQGQWMKVWEEKLMTAFEELDTPADLNAVVKGFMGDFSHSEQSLNHLGICNGSLKAMLFPQTQFLSPSSTFSLEGFDNSRRPSTSESIQLSPTGRERALSLTSQSPTSAHFERPFEERRHSGGSRLSPLIALGPAIPVMPQIVNAPRQRAGSAQFPSRSSLTVTPPVSQRPFSGMTADRQLHTPVTQTYSPSLEDRPGSTAYSLTSTLFDGPETQSAYTSSATLIDPRTEGISRTASPGPSPMFSSAMPMEDDREVKSDGESNSNSRGTSGNTSRPPSIASSGQGQGQRRALMLSNNRAPIFVVASLYEFNIDKERREAGFPYLTYVQGEIFDVVGTKGEIWLAKNQDDVNGELGWIWCKHFARL